MAGVCIIAGVRAFAVQSRTAPSLRNAEHGGSLLTIERTRKTHGKHDASLETYGLPPWLVVTWHSQWRCLGHAVSHAVVHERVR